MFFSNFILPLLRSGCRSSCKLHPMVPLGNLTPSPRGSPYVSQLSATLIPSQTALHSVCNSVWDGYKTQTGDLKQCFSFIHNQSNNQMNCSTCWELERKEKKICIKLWQRWRYLWQMVFQFRFFWIMVMTPYQKWSLAWNPRACNGQYIGAWIERCGFLHLPWLRVIVLCSCARRVTFTDWQNAGSMLLLPSDE